MEILPIILSLPKKFIEHLLFLVWSILWDLLGGAVCGKKILPKSPGHNGKS
jgi:hypothetical protein